MSRTALNVAFALMLIMGTVFSQTCKGMTLTAVNWASNWQQVAFTVLLICYLALGMIYGLAIAFNMPKVVSSVKKDLMYLAFISILAGALYITDDIMNNTFLPSFANQSLLNASATRQSASFCHYSNVVGWQDLQQHSIEYAVCLREKNVDYFEAFMDINFVLGFVSSITLVITPLELIGLSITPGAALKPVIDTIGYGLYMIAINIAQLKAQEVILCFSKTYMFTMVLPLGIALSAFPLTRSAGGTLISLAVGFYIVLPVAYLLSEEIVQDYCSGHGNCDIGSTPGEIASRFSGSARDLVDDMFRSEGRSSSQLADIFSLNGPMGPVMYILGIASTLLPLISLIVTLMFVKSFSRIFGAEADFSAMIKIL